MQRATTLSRKIVVTTTVDLGGADNLVAVTAEVKEGGTAGQQPVRAANRGTAGDGARSITCFEIAPHTYLGLTSAPRRIRLLQVDESVFIFVPRTTPIERLETIVTRLLNAIQESGRNVKRISWAGGSTGETGAEEFLDSDSFADSDLKTRMIHLNEAMLDDLT